MKIKLKFWVVLALLVSFSACYYDNKEDLYSNFPQETCDTTIVSFAADVLPLITQQCGSCHSASVQTAGLVLTNHTNIAEAMNNRPLLDRVNKTPGDAQLMPPGGKLTPCQIATLTAWKNQGLLNN